MTGTFTPLALDFELLLDRSPYPFKAEQQASIDQHWETVKKGAYNGPVIAFQGLEGSSLHARLIDYKTSLALQSSPELSSATGLAPLGVSGITFVGSKVVVGKRAASTGSYAGYYELAPAGCLEHGRPKDQILQELEEETGLKEAMVKSLELVGMVFDPQYPVYDLCYRIEVGEEAADLLPGETEEYQSLRLVEVEELAELFAQEREQVVLTSWVLLQAIL